MRRGIHHVALAWTLVFAPVLVADDIDLLLPADAQDGVHVQVLVDIPAQANDSILCERMADCAPPFVSDAVWRQLNTQYEEEGSVTASGLFRAVIAALVLREDFLGYRFSLQVSNYQDTALAPIAGNRGGGTFLAGYQHAPGTRDGFLQALAALPLGRFAEGHAFQPAESVLEWLRYLRGGRVLAGRDTAGNFGMAQPQPDYDQAVIAGDSYRPPLHRPDACPAFLSIVFTVSPARHDRDFDALLAMALPGFAGGGPAALFRHLLGNEVSLVPTLDARMPLADAWVVSTRAGAGTAAELATVDRTLFVDEPIVLEQTLAAALRRAGATPASLSGPTLHASRSGGGGTLYLPLYQPAPGGLWPGNLKKYRLDTDAAPLAVVRDASGQPALDDRGLPREQSVSFWTDVSRLPDGDGGLVIPGRDGAIVPRGGSGQQLAGHGGDAPAGDQRRPIFYELPNGSGLARLESNDTVAAQLRPVIDPESRLESQELLALLDWAQGLADENGPPGSRAWLQGAVLHSRPLVIDYGDAVGRERNYLFFGSDDGLFRIVEDTDEDGTQSGREIFALYPLEGLRLLGRRFRQPPDYRKRDYGVDGSPVALLHDANGDGRLEAAQGDEAYVFFGLRRGGHRYIALDVIDPYNPRLLWTLAPDDNFAELALTFSKPVSGKVNYNGNPVDALLFGGGYHGGWRGDRRIGKDAGAAPDPVGNAIFVVNARTGDLIWKAVHGATGTASNNRYEHAGLGHSVPAPLAALRDGHGVIHRLYVGDTGGSLWRVDLPPAAGADGQHRRDNWFITRLADLARTPAGSNDLDLRFFHRADVVRTRDQTGPYDGVVLQSGDRASPGDTVARNYLFHVKDRETVSGSGAVRAENDAPLPPGRLLFEELPDQLDCVTGDESGVPGFDVSCGSASYPKGWRLPLEGDGEKGLSAPLVDNGRVFATTYQPPAVQTCPRAPGRAHLYVVELASGAAAVNRQRRYKLNAPSPTDVQRFADLLYIPGGGARLYDLDGDGERELSPLLPSEAGTLYGLYWRYPQLDPL